MARKSIIALAGALTASLVILIIWAVAESDVLTGLRNVAADRWGVVTLVDLGAGLLFVLLWMRLLEPRTGVWLAWTAGVLTLGNLATLVFVLVRIVRFASVREALLGRVREPRTTPPAIRDRDG